MTNMGKGDTKCPMCRCVIIEPNTEILDLKQQITSLQELNGQSLQQIREITIMLGGLHIGSSIELAQFIARYRIERRVIHDNFGASGMSLMDFANIN